MKTEMKEGEEIIQNHPFRRDLFNQHLQDAQSFRQDYGDNAQHLRYGRPFAERKKPLLWGYKVPAILEKLGIGGYKVPKWKKIKKESTIYNLRETGLSELRTHLDQNNYLRVHDPVGNKFLGFALDKDGNVLFKDFSKLVRV